MIKMVIVFDGVVVGGGIVIVLVYWLGELWFMVKVKYIDNVNYEVSWFYDFFLLVRCELMDFCW